MKVIDAIICQTEPLTLSLQLENSLANRIHGAWATENPPTWETSSPDMTLAPQLNGIECVVTPNSPNFAGVVFINYAANVDRNMTGQYERLSGTTQLEFQPATKVAQLGTSTAAANAVSFKKVLA